MAESFRKNTPKEPKPAEKEPKVKGTENEVEKEKKTFNLGFLSDKRFHLAVGFFLLSVSIFCTIALLSYPFTGFADQSVIEALRETGVKDSGQEIENWLGLTGANIAYFLIYKWFGISSFLLMPILFFTGFKIVFRVEPISLKSLTTFCIFFLFWLSLLFGFMAFVSKSAEYIGFLGGGIGYEMAVWADSLVGWGTFLALGFMLLSFIIYFYNITQIEWGNKPVAQSKMSVSENLVPKTTEEKIGLEDEEEYESYIENDVEIKASNETLAVENTIPSQINVSPMKTVLGGKIAFEITENKVEPILESVETLAHNTDVEAVNTGTEKSIVIPEEPATITDFDPTGMGDFDPTLELSSYKYPGIDLLKDYGVTKAHVNEDELNDNINKIVETLGNYSIGIEKIKATIGPTVTLYEMVPQAGVRISKIKSLEDDIALSLAALGIRIIAPIPGKGTIGIEVPNVNKEMVPMRTLLISEKYVSAVMDLPIVLGKTISNEIYISDLAKMPHLLIAGATGQGKSVGLNVILTSLLYKKHPAQIKFVLVDPKKVELTPYKLIEKHFLAKLPDGDEAIITDNKKVVNTLNSLCIEMDNRYKLLQTASCRNLKEYNAKFISRQLNPNKGHKYLPYIVLVIDELADLMMTVGKEVEQPIARLAQLARAIGIHLIVATQRPSVNVITGIIKANFPARLSFKVSQKTDSRTILDTSGADQLIGQGDMLLSENNNLTRIQCAFVDTPEVERICEFIGNQRGYNSAYELPEYYGSEEGASEKEEFDPSKKDPLFDEAARLIVLHQQGSTSLIQRKLSLGYNRAGRLMDQLEATGIVGPNEGSKAREVYYKDEESLEMLLKSM